MTVAVLPGSKHVCFIIHDGRPYCFDLNEILALPAGLRYRNRFAQQWIEPGLRDGIRDGRIDIIGKQVGGRLIRLPDDSELQRMLRTLRDH